MVILDLLHFNNQFLISLLNSKENQKKPTEILFGQFECMHQFRDNLILETNSEWCNRNSEFQVAAKEYENKVDFRMYRVICESTSE